MLLKYCIIELPSTLLSPSLKKKSTPKKFLIFKEWNFLAPRLKNSLYFRKWNFLALILRNFLYFLKRKLSYIWKIELFYISGNGNPEKFLIFQETELFYTSENGNHETELFLYFRKQKHKKLLIFQEVTFTAQKMKKAYSEIMSYILGKGTF